MNQEVISLDTVKTQAERIAHQIADGLPEKIKNKNLVYRDAIDIRLYGVPRGGIAAAYAVALALRGLVHINVDDACVRIVGQPSEATNIIDDIYDSGATFRRYQAAFPNTQFHVLFDKTVTTWAGRWLVLPWEVGDGDASAEDIVVRLLQYIGEDPTREGLQDTPRRYLAAWREWARGYGQDPAEILKTFADGAKAYDEMVVVHNIPVASKCEHHLADMVGTAHVGYIPNNRIVGLSKIPRVVDVFARRLQVQERMTVQIADAIHDTLNPFGVGVLLRCSHSCMSTRGVNIHGSVTTTSAMRGALLEKPEARGEFLRLCEAAEK